MANTHIHLSWPTGMRLFPEPRPLALLPPQHEHSIAAPFAISKNIFYGALNPAVPLTIASVYVVTVLFLNGVNKRRENKPWPISRYRAFQNFIVAHNVFLAIYSLATFLAMARAISRVWPGLENDAGAAGIADALCKLHGPRGLGDAATYNTTINIFEIKNPLVKLAYDGLPDPTDVGRLWNEGLAFWGWFFYVSKFYEVIDTLIILAKGRRSATLQTYHHAGAMLCMWAGIRYMSPPIWMFVFVNSLIHTLMYTYFTLSALGKKVPRSLKRLLTSLQIAQFVFGASYAAAHLFISYDVPINTPYEVFHVVKKAASSVSSAAVAATSAVSSFAESPSTPPNLNQWVKKLLLRAAGEEGVAERVHDYQHDEYLRPHLAEKIEHFNEQQSPNSETRYHSVLTRTQCIDTSGEAFAIYLNLLYLAPLTYLFGRFFVRAYLNRGKPRNASSAAKQITGSSRQAAHETDRAIEKAGEKAGDSLVAGAEELKKEAQSLQQELREDVQRLREGTFLDEKKVNNVKASAKDAASNVETSVKSAASQAQASTQEFKDKNAPAVKQAASDVQNASKDVVNKAAPHVKNAAKSAQDAAKNAPASAQKAADNVKSAAKQATDQTPPSVKQAASDVKTAGKDVANAAAPAAKNVAGNVRAVATEAAAGTPPTAKQVVADVQMAAKDVADTASSAAKNAADSAPPAVKQAAADVQTAAKDVAAAASTAVGDAATNVGKTTEEKNLGLAKSKFAVTDPVESALADTDAVRPGADVEGANEVKLNEDEDDVMGQSGSLIDLSASQRGA